MLRRYLYDPEFSQGLVHRQDEIDEFLKSVVRSVAEQEESRRAQTPAFRFPMKMKNLFTLARLRHRLGLSVRSDVGDRKTGIPC
jgi:hypothetical protein